MGGQAKRNFHGTVLIADDHAVFRLGLVQLLRRSLKVKRFLEAECFVSTPERNCIGEPEQKSITGTSKKAPDIGGLLAFAFQS